MSRSVFWSHYIDVKNSLYPFGYGLSYSKFEYSDLKLRCFFSKNGKIVVSVKVKNTGKVTGKK
jgi:beta-glucosidase